METPGIWLCIVLILGFTAILLGAVDPLEGSFVVLAGVGVCALAAAAAGSRHRLLLFGSFALVAFGVVALMTLSWIGGIGGEEGLSPWWTVLLVPIPIGWVAGLVGAGLTLVETFKHSSPPKHAAQ